MIENIEKYILDNYTSPDFPQSYEAFIKENYQDIVPDLILGDEQLTDITNKVIKGEEVDDSYLGTFKDYLGDTVYEPEVDFTKSLAIQARYIDDNEYLEWLNDEKMAKVLAEFPTRKQFIDHLGPMIEDIAEKYGDDPNLDLLINNMTYKSHPLAFYEFSQSDDFSEQDGDFGFREWIRKGINSIKKLRTRDKNENALSEGTDASSEDSIKLTNKDLKYIAENGTPEQQELAKDIIDKKKQIIRDTLASGGTLATGVLSGGVVEKVTEVPLKISNSLSPGAITQSSVRATGEIHDPNVWLQGQVRNAWEMSEKEGKTTSEKVIEHLKGLKDSGVIKLEDVPRKKYSRSDSSTGEIPMGPAKDNSLVNAGLKSRPNEFSEDPIEDKLLSMRSDIDKKLDRSDKMYSKVRSLLTSGDMDSDSYLSSEWVSDWRDRRAINKYRKEQKRKKEFKDAKYKVDKELGINNNNSKLVSTIANVATPILLSKITSDSKSNDEELEKLRLENENLKLRQQQRYSRDYSEGDFTSDDAEYLGKEHDRSDDFLKNHGFGSDSEKKDKPQVESKIEDSNQIDSKSEPKPEPKSQDSKKRSSRVKKTPVDEREEALKNAEIDKQYEDRASALGKMWSTDEDGKRILIDKPKEPEQEVNSQEESPNPSRKPRTSRPKLTEEDQLESAEKAAASDERAAKLGMHFEDDGKGGRKLVKDTPKPEPEVKSQSESKPELESDSEESQLSAAKRAKANDDEAAKLGKVWKTDENGKRVLVDKPKEEPKPLENKSIRRRNIRSELRESGAFDGLNLAQRHELVSRTKEARKRSNFNNSLIQAGLKSSDSESNSKSNSSGGLSGLLSSATGSVKDILKEVGNSKVYKDIRRGQVVDRTGKVLRYITDTAKGAVKTGANLLFGSNNQSRPPVNGYNYRYMAASEYEDKKEGARWE